MTELLTPADQFNLTLLNNIEDNIKCFPVQTYGPGEFAVSGAIECPYLIGKLYQTTMPIYLIELITDTTYEPIIVANDVYIPANEVLVFLGVERFYFQKNEFEDSFSVYTLRFLYGENIYFDLVPARFTDDDIDWSYLTSTNLSIYMKKVLKGSIELLGNP